MKLQATFLKPSSPKISLQAVVERWQLRVHTQTHLSARTRGSLRGQQGPPCFSRLSLWGSCCWEGDLSSRGRTQRRKSDERAEALQESSYLTKLSRGWGCYSYLLSWLRKKIPILGKLHSRHTKFHFSCSAAMPEVHTSTIIRCVGPHISSA